MRPIPGPPPSELAELTRIEDRVSFVYVERALVHRENNAITVQDDRGVVHIPSATIGALLLGPGTNVTHQAMTVLADSGGTAVWVGEQGVRYYAHGRTLSRTSRWLERQAAIVSNQSRRLDVARRMYAMRFDGEDVSRLTMQQLRGREGARVKNIYRRNSERTGVSWTRRDYDPDDFDDSDAINQSLSAATTCLYGLVHAVIVALGCSPGLGIVHTGHDRSFVYDIADLYKADTAVPVAFDVVASAPEDIGMATRHAMRDAIYDAKLLKRCASDVQNLLAEDDQADVQDWDVVYLWDGGRRAVSGGTNFDDEPPW